MPFASSVIQFSIHSVLNNFRTYILYLDMLFELLGCNNLGLNQRFHKDYKLKRLGEVFLVTVINKQKH